MCGPPLFLTHFILSRTLSSHVFTFFYNPIQSDFQGPADTFAGFISLGPRGWTHSRLLLSGNGPSTGSGKPSFSDPFHLDGTLLTRVFTKKIFFGVISRY
jgi:hypothetical protein